MEPLVWDVIPEIQSLSVDPISHLREPSRLSSAMIAELCAEKGFRQKEFLNTF